MDSLKTIRHDLREVGIIRQVRLKNITNIGYGFNKSRKHNLKKSVKYIYCVLKVPSKLIMDLIRAKSSIFS